MPFFKVIKNKVRFRALKKRPDKTFHGKWYLKGYNRADYDTVVDYSPIWSPYGLFLRWTIARYNTKAPTDLVVAELLIGDERWAFPSECVQEMTPEEMEAIMKGKSE